MRLFGKSEEKRAREAAADAEIARLKTLTPTELAAMLLPAMAADGVGQGHTMRVQQLCDYLLRDFQSPGKLRALELSSRTYDALDDLQKLGLVSSVSIQRSPLWKITSRGEQALADGSLAARLDRR
jgi:hypothetical protein